MEEKEAFTAPIVLQEYNFEATEKTALKNSILFFSLVNLIYFAFIDKLSYRKVLTNDSRQNFIRVTHFTVKLRGCKITFEEVFSAVHPIVHVPVSQSTMRSPMYYRFRVPVKTCKTLERTQLIRGTTDNYQKENTQRLKYASS